MSLFKQSTYKTIDYNNISVSLPNNKDIFKNDINKKKIDNKIKNYYEITYNTGVDNFDNFTFDNKNYKATKIYVYSLLHNNIENITTDSETDIIGELVIEYSFNNSIIYTCYLLKKNINTNATAIKTEEPDKIDDIINYMYKCDGNNCAIKLTSVKLNQILSPSTTVNNKFIYYKDKNNKNIIVFLTPIDITYEDDSIFLSNLLKSTSLFDINPAPTGSSSPAPDPDDDILDCELVGVGTEKKPIDKLSINALTDELNRNIDLNRITISLFGLIVLIMIALIVVPYLFSLIIGKCDDSESNKRMSSTFILSTIFMICYVFLLFYIGFNKNNTTILIVGLITALIYILSIIIILTQNQDFTFLFSFDTLETLICECVKFTIKNIIPKYIGIFIITIILIAIVLSIQKKDLKKTYGDTVGIWAIYIIPISIILSLVSYSPGDSSSCSNKI
jgi:hypothetical protein